MRVLRVLAAAGSLTLALSSMGWTQANSGQGSGYGNQGSGQNNSNGRTVNPSPSLPPIVPPDMEPPPKMEQDQAKARNVDRQKQLVQDTQKLVALANELKVDVDKSNKDTLSLDVVRKADEIEKLAHSVKER